MIKNLPANARDAGDTVSIPWLGRSPGEGNGIHSSILAQKISRTEEPWGGKEEDTPERLRVGALLWRHQLFHPVQGGDC